MQAEKRMFITFTFAFRQYQNPASPALVPRSPIELGHCDRCVASRWPLCACQKKFGATVTHRTPGRDADKTVPRLFADRRTSGLRGKPKSENCAERRGQRRPKGGILSMRGNSPFP